MSAIPIPFASWPSSAEVVTARESVASDDPTLRKEWESREAELIAIGRYRDNWDGYDSPAPDPRIVDAALQILRAMRSHDRWNPPMRATVSPDGLVALEWQSDGTYLRAEITEGGEVDWMEAKSGGPVKFWTHRLTVESPDELPNDQTREDAWQLNDRVVGGAAVSLGAR